MKRTLSTLGLGLAFLLLPAAASAQSDGGFQRGTLAIGAERMTGLYFYSFKSQVPIDGTNRSVDVTTSGTQLNLLWNSNLVDVPRGIGANPASVPRLGVDYMGTDLVSVGGSVGYFSASGSQKQSDTGVSVDTVTVSGFAFAPRVGFALHLGSSFLFWPRVGVSYFHIKGERSGGGSTSGSIWDIVAEPMFVYSPVPHFGFAFGPLLELGVAGSYEIRDNNGVSRSTDTTVTNYGAIAGVVGYL